MSSPSTSLVGSTAESIDSASPIIQAGEPWLPEPGELPTRTHIAFCWLWPSSSVTTGSL
ncbi:hypothetical protein F511_20574 [Dorcoceras hygrometricum]|uniref:Uncharacterized protein n=1 Tax=Dorcoceras hygrometricum TaxID=472368 RepID=A0A2Z7CWG8_9LAMI|nr:hypothetical protein F511_20574 [Dorcoceras hygrometricum]